MNRDQLEEFIKQKMERGGKFTKPPKEFVQSLDREVTEFKLPPKAPITQKIWHFTHDCFIPKCKECKKQEVSWNPTTKQYRDFCSAKCSNSNKNKIKKTQTVFDNNGGHPSKRKEVREKIEKTNMKRYGVSTPLLTTKSQENMKKAVKSKEHREKMSRKLLENLDHIEAMKTGRRKWIEENPGKLEESYRQSVIQKLSIYGVYDESSMKKYLINQHHTNGKSFSRIAKTVGLPVYTICKWFDRLGIEKKYYYSSAEQDELQSFLENELKIKVFKNDRKLLDGGEIDLYVPEAGFGIEYCGLYWHSEAFKSRNYHVDKLVESARKGVRLITIFQDEFLHKPDLVKRMIAHKLGVSRERRIYARNTSITYPSYQLVKAFLEKNHIQGTSNGGLLYIGLEYERELVSVMVFKRRSSNEVELTRFANNGLVVGGFSKLLKHSQYLLHERGVEYISSFADRRWSEGDVYKRNGFVLEKILDPDYAYVKNDVRLHKFSMRNAPQIVGQEVSINRACEILGYSRIWDCGKIKFKKCIQK